MSEPIDLAAARSRKVAAVVCDDPNEGTHLRGEAVCGACDHHWEAVQPTGGDRHLECPKCHSYWGVFKHAVEPPVGSRLWHCNCGETLFWLTADGAMCRRCGVVSSDWAETARRP